jgi:hypothetical protein
MRIEMECNRCGSKIVTRSLAEVTTWDANHRESCVGPKAPPINPDPLGSTEVRG